jgi:hypothetical protein
MIDYEDLLEYGIIILQIIAVVLFVIALTI